MQLERDREAAAAVEAARAVAVVPELKMSAPKVPSVMSSPMASATRSESEAHWLIAKEEVDQIFNCEVAKFVEASSTLKPAAVAVRELSDEVQAFVGYSNGPVLLGTRTGLHDDKNAYMGTHTRQWWS